MQEVDFVNIISRYVPLPAITELWKFFGSNVVNLKITKDRVTKFGDFRYSNGGTKVSQITVNGGLNKYSFLITLLHEMAHYKVYIQYSKACKPHGVEWKKAFQKIVAPFINSGIFPQPLETVYRKHMQNPRAATHSDMDLLRCLNLYNSESEVENIHLEDIAFGEKFAFKGRVFIKEEKRRTRYMCTDVNSKRKYTINGLATIEKV